ncbi:MULTISPECIES: HXXEE domain-containing protein [unclassified Campylobacter]|uniref:HXXEE domain-containing protein n=1 Tax=unclassified Campylobacter TaxID=2593542 RepID=UPI0014732990|nr:MULTISPECIES: HXXEE domain-containing protein [unclassified Campylobacter]
MQEYVWLFPIIFVFHDFEEIIFLRFWLDKNKDFLEKNYPFVLKRYESISSEAFAFGVFEEFVLCIIICILAVWADNKFVWLIWLGCFSACAIHFIVHIFQAVIIKRYIPAIVTSVITLPVSIWIIAKSYNEIAVTPKEFATFTIIGVIIVFINLKFALFLISKFQKFLDTK